MGAVEQSGKGGVLTIAVTLGLASTASRLDAPAENPRAAALPELQVEPESG